MDCLLKIFVPEKFSVATLCVAIKKRSLAERGPNRRMSVPMAAVWIAFPKFWGLENLWVVILCAAMKPRSLAQRGPSRRMNAPMAAAWVAIHKMFGPANF